MTSTPLNAAGLVRRSTALVGRKISSAYKIGPPDQLNHVILSGTVNGVNKANDNEKSYASISLKTCDIYREAKGYGMKVVSHRTQVFGSGLYEKATELNNGDRTCDHSYLRAFPSDPLGRFWMYCVVARSICVHQSPPDDLDEQSHSGSITEEKPPPMNNATEV
ncbi:hypothetical protein D915_004739 [Fasciola hepatica]|uniref:Uncharacterized protein n=1 Tax=Fasciola hepatica TaxID=6192 RepID=A0A4E0RDT6_FASHE|nr:hypothetical protein D915_004739 [Fasciola hepatica]